MAAPAPTSPTPCSPSTHLTETPYYHPLVTKSEIQNCSVEDFLFFSLCMNIDIIIPIIITVIIVV